MAIRLRKVGNLMVALCAFETDPEPGDLYLDDGHHYALSAKFAQDRQGQTITAKYPLEWAAMETQKKRDAREEYDKWHASHARWHAHRNDECGDVCGFQ